MSFVPNNFLYVICTSHVNVIYQLSCHLYRSVSFAKKAQHEVIYSLYGENAVEPGYRSLLYTFTHLCIMNVHTVHMF